MVWGTVSHRMDGGPACGYGKQLMKRCVMERANEDGLIFRLEVRPRFTLPQEGKQGEDGGGWTAVTDGGALPAGGRAQSRGSHRDGAFISPDLSQLLP